MLDQHEGTFRCIEQAARGMTRSQLEAEYIRLTGQSFLADVNAAQQRAEEAAAADRASR